MRFGTNVSRRPGRDCWCSIPWAACFMLLAPLLAMSQQAPKSPVGATEVDLRYTLETTSETTGQPTHRSAQTVYIKGKRKRMDDAQSSTIIQCDLRQYVFIDRRANTCCVTPFAPEAPLTPSPGGAPKKPRKGGVVRTDVEVKDMGERRQLFGLNARHVVAKYSTDSAAGSCLGAHRTGGATDAWLADLPAAARADFCSVEPAHPLDWKPEPRGSECEDTYKSDVKGDPNLFEDAFLLSWRSENTYDGGTTKSIGTVKDLSFSRLDPSLFEVPAHCECSRERPTPTEPPTEPELQVQESPTELRIELAGDILFDFNSSAVRSAAEATLRRVAELIQKYPQSGIVVEGHTDSLGSESFNLSLSQRRAESVKKWLVEVGGIESGRIETKGLGKSRPVAPNVKADGSDDPAGRQKNRRVEITVRK